MLALVGVGKKSLQDNEEKRPEFSLLPVSPRVRLRFDQVSEERLRQVLGIMTAEPAPANERINWRPVIATQLGQRFPRGHGRFQVARAGGDHAPMRRWKSGASAL